MTSLLSRLAGGMGALRRSQARAVDGLVGNVKGLRALDVGCAGGVFAQRLARRGAIVVGVDPDPTFASTQRERARSGVGFARANGYALPFADASFDLVSLYSVLQMVDEPKRLLAECRRVLRPEGRVLVNVPLGYPRVEEAYATGTRRLVRRLARAPADLDAFRAARFAEKSHGRIGYYTSADLGRSLADAGFRVERTLHAPTGAFARWYQWGLLRDTAAKSEAITRYALLPLAPFARASVDPHPSDAIEIFVVGSPA